MNNSSSIQSTATEQRTLYFNSFNRLVKFSFEFAVVLLITNVLFILATLTGNFIVILLVKVYHQLRVPANYLLANLAVADILNAFVIQILNARGLYSFVTLPKDRELLIVSLEAVPFVDAFGLMIVYVNVTCLCLISLDRYIAIKYSLSYISIVSTQRVKVVIAVSWTTGIVVGAVASFLFPVDDKRMVPETILAIGAVFMIAFYVKINKISRLHSRKIRAQNMAVDTNARNIRNERRGLKTIALISISLFASYVPLMLSGLEKSLSSSEVSELRLNLREAYRQAAILLLFAKSVVNPMLYFFRNRTARVYTFKLFMCVKEKVNCNVN